MVKVVDVREKDARDEARAATVLVRVGKIRPNPFRQIGSYPIDPKKVMALRESLRATGFWDNVVARKVDGHVEIAYGHHRLAALKDEFGPDHRVSLIIKKLDDTTMLRIMARENMEEWGASAVVEHETVKAVVVAYGDGKIKLPPVPKDTPKSKLRYAPSFVRREPSTPRAKGRPYTTESVAQYLGWLKPSGAPQRKVQSAIWALELIEQKLLAADELRGLSTTEAAELVKEVRRKREEASARAVEAKERVRAAEREAEQAREERQQAKAKGEKAQADVATRKLRKAKRVAAVERRRARSEAREGQERAVEVGKKLSEGLRSKQMTAGQVKHRARDLEAESGSSERTDTENRVNSIAEALARKFGRFLAPGSGRRAFLEKLPLCRRYLQSDVRKSLVRELRRISRTTGELGLALSA